MLSEVSCASRSKRDVWVNGFILDVIENENSFKPVVQTTINAEGTSTTLIPGLVTADEKVQKKNDVKARSMLLMALTNEHLLTFNPYKDANTLFAAIQTRFGSNDATKKTQNTLLKKMYENFSAPSTESLDSIFNRLQKINTYVMVWRNNPDLDITSFDDLYNNFKIVEQEVKGTASSSLSSQNVAFVSSSSSTNEVNTAYGISTANLSDATVYAFSANQPNGSQHVHEDLEQIHEDDLEEMDLKSQLALLSMRTRRECKGPRNQDSRNWNQDSSRRTVNMEETSSKAMLAIDGAGFDWSYMEDDEVPSNMALMAFSDSEPEFEGYGPKTSKSISEDTSNEVREYPDALLANYNYHQRERVVSGNNYTRVNYNYSAKKSHPSAHRNIVPRAIFMKTGLKPLNTARPVNTAHPKTTVNGARPMPKAVTTARPNLTVVNAVRENQGHPQKEDQGYVDTNESQVLLKVPRKNNMYSVDMKNIVPKESLTCLVAKATLDESMLWHKRLDHLCKFDGKYDDGFFVGYSLNSKAFRVYNIRTRKVKENLHVRFLEDKPIIAGTKESNGAGHSSKEPRSSQDYILMPLWKDGSLFDSSSNDASNDEPQPSNDAEKKDDEGGIDDQESTKNSAQNVNTARPSINTASINFNTGNL
ncbi:hypothetical protein Tco_0835635, partial [Tanacetum coccineum]